MPLRKESGRTGSLRLIDVTGYDLSACGGTHVERTGGIGVIAIGSAEKFKGGSRIEFLCGGRALQRFRVWRGALSAMQKHLSVPPIDMAPAIERMQEDAKAVQRSVRGFQEKLAVHEAQALLARGGNLIAEVIEGWDAQGLKAIAARRHRRAARRRRRAVYVDQPRASGVARGASSPVDAAALLKQLTAAFGGKGGGKPDLAQGGGLGAPVSELVAFTRSLI